ncbi:hypothetical protein AVEN_124433-1 [Araneus ventricosus]|uniref:Uncharacterized protein n=1 Tax=Araneus ventricosus TaxID=182803 RepID=A0A4Y2EDA3_ARAVE|nr:hypothetical protein AVEN_124433-1 [Araneus ventricosus]
MKASLGLYLLPYLLKEPVECFVEEVTSDVEDLQSVVPKIFAVGNFEDINFCIVAENEILFRTNNFVTAVGMLMSFFLR